MKTIKNKVLLFALLASGCSLQGSDRSTSPFSLYEPFLGFNTILEDGPSQLVMLGRAPITDPVRYATVAELQATNDALQAQIDEFRDSQERLMESFLRTEALVRESFGEVEASVGAAEESERATTQSG